MHTPITMQSAKRLVATDVYAHLDPQGAHRPSVLTVPLQRSLFVAGPFIAENFSFQLGFWTVE